MTRQLDWADFRAPDFTDIDPMRTIAVLPLAAIEQHGPHLPVGTDTFIAQGMLKHLRAHCPPDLDLRILPVQAVGKSNEHLWAAGTLSLSAATALAVWQEIVQGVAATGIRKMVLVNSHGGNADLMSILARELRLMGVLAVKCSWGAFGFPEGFYGEQELDHGLHGGDIETSLMLAFRPDTVDMAQAQDFRSSAETGVIAPVGAVSYGWIASDLNPQGVVGQAHLASAEKGCATCAHQVAGFIAMLKDLQDAPLFNDMG